MAIQNLYPPLRPSLNLNFTSGHFDPRIEFTRNSTATYFGSDGLLKIAAANEPRIDHDPVTGECKGFLVEEARTNRLTYSEQFSNAAWTKTRASITANAVVAPDGTMTADKLVENTTNDAHFLYQDTPSIAANTVSTGTVFAQLGERRYLQLRVTDPSNANNHVRAVFDLQTGTVTETVNVGVASGVVASIDPDGAGRYRCSVSGIPSTSPGIGTRLEIYLMSAPAGTAVYTGNGISGIYIWGAQLEANAFPTSYIPTPATFTSRNSTATYFDSTGVMRTAAINEPRYDHGYVNGQWVSKGLVLENSATNLVAYSEQFGDASWGKTRATITANAVVAPDGTMTADKLVEDSSITATHYIYSQGNVSAGVAYTYSLFAKAAERTQAKIIFHSTNGAFNVPASALFDLAAGVVVSISSSEITASIVSVGNGWFRCSASRIAAATTVANIAAHLALNTTEAYTGDGTSGIYIWGAQLEEGTQPTSYIKTEATSVTRAADLSTSSAVTRAADSAVMTGANFSSWYRQDEGTVTSEHSSVIPAAVAASSVAWAIGDNSTFNESIYLAKAVSGNALLFSIVDGGVSQFGDNNINQAFTPDSFLKAACAYKLNDSAAVGAVLKTDSLCTIPTVSSLAIGRAAWSAGNFMNGHIKRLAYYPRRLTNDQLVTLAQ